MDSAKMKAVSRAHKNKLTEQGGNASSEKTSFLDVISAASGKAVEEALIWGS